MASSSWSRARLGAVPHPHCSTSGPLLQELNCVGQGGFCPFPKPYSWKSVSEMGPTIHVMRKWASVGNSRQCGLPTEQPTYPNHLETLPSSSEAGCLVAQARPLTGEERLQGAVSPPKMSGSYLLIHIQVCFPF